MEKETYETLPEGYFEVLDINGNGLIKIGEDTYRSTRTGNIYFYNGKRLLLIEEIKEAMNKDNLDSKASNT
jgi:hypothetical protein